DQEEALTLSDRLVVMNHGRIEQVGTPVELYRKPRTAFVAQFLGHPNFLSGEVVEARAGEVAVRVGPAIVRAAHEEPLAPGAAVAVVLRAESARLARPPVDPAGNALPGTIAYTVYLGTSAEYEVRLAPGRRCGSSSRSPAAPRRSGTARRWRSPGRRRTRSSSPDRAMRLPGSSR